MTQSQAPSCPPTHVDPYSAEGHLEEMVLCMGCSEGIDSMAAKTQGLTPESLANHTAFLQLDLADPEFRHSKRVRARLTAYFNAAIASRRLPELTCVDPATPATMHSQSEPLDLRMKCWTNHILAG